jgi:methyl-accepting chemotaxis protein WspA
MRYRPSMILLVVLVASAVAAAALVTTYVTSRIGLRQEIEKQALVLAETAASEVDASENARAFAAKSFASTEYKSIEHRLRDLRDTWRRAGMDVRYLYTLVPDTSSPSGLAYAVDAEETEGEKSPVGEGWKALRADVAKFDYRKAQAFEYTDRYGNFVGGFAPVLNSQGDTLMVVGVDLNGAAIDQASWHTLYLSAGPVALLMLLAVLASGVLGERMVRPLERLRSVAERLGGGDLTAQADTTAPGEAGDIARALNATLSSLRSTIRNADATAMRVHEVCERLLETGEARRTAMRLAADRTADAARRARGISEAATGVATDATAAGSAARQAVDVGVRMLNDVTQINNGVQGVIERGQDLSRSLKTMRERAATVDAALEALVQVANRSSVLSLNAEIEANQAGESGRGFAVVAREIRRLAEQAAANSLQIERNVAALHESLNSSARASDGFSAAAEQASSQSVRLSTAIIESIRQLEDLGPRLHSVGERSEQFQREGGVMSSGLVEAESAVTELRTFLESTESTLVELRDRSAEVNRLLAQLKTDQ